jgi:hypothetical protein
LWVIESRRRAHDYLGADIAGIAGPIFDDELLAEPRRKPLTDQARSDVSRAAGRPTNYDARWSRWIGLGTRDPRYSRESGSTRCQMQKLPTWKFHVAP